MEDYVEGENTEEPAAEYLDDEESEYRINGPETDYVGGASNVALVDEGFNDELEPGLQEEPPGDVGSHQL